VRYDQNKLLEPSHIDLLGSYLDCNKEIAICCTELVKTTIKIPYEASWKQACQAILENFTPTQSQFVPCKSQVVEPWQQAIDNLQVEFSMKLQ
jgi:hypothetical protein